MKAASTKTAVVFTVLLGAMTALPIASALADPPAGRDSNAMTNNGSTGVYDGFDRFKDSAGRPLPGWEYLFDTPN